MMEQNATIGTVQRGLVTIDWILAGVAVSALLLAAAAVVRNSADDDTTRGIGGLRALAEGDVMLAFQDFSFSSDGWSTNTIATDLPGLGPVLSLRGDQPVARTFTRPPGTSDVHIFADVHLMGDWSTGLRVAIDDAPILMLTRPQGDEVAADVPSDVTVTRSDIHVAGMQSIEMTPLVGQTATLNSDNSFTSYTMHIRMVDPGETFTFRLSPVDAPAGNGPWALDNVTVIAIDAPPSTEG